jgi:hypothetical protein
MKKAVFILGMHRSGTSCLAKCLAANGLSFVLDQLGPTFNREHLEYGEVARLNNKILRNWKNPKIPDSALKKFIGKKMVNRFIRKHHKGDGRVGIKDPRLALTFHLWADAVQEFQVVAIYRRPFEVVRSFDKRDPGYSRIERNNALELWRLTNHKILELQKELRFPITSFNLPTDVFRESVEKMSDYLGLRFNPEGFENTFVESRKHHLDYDMPAALRSTYEELERCRLCSGGETTRR